MGHSPLEMEDCDIGHVFEALECAIDVKDEFASFYDGEFDLVHVRIGEIVVAEIPTRELLAEMGMLPRVLWQTDEQGSL